MEYKGYQGSVEVGVEDRVLYGKVIGIGALISYEGTDVNSLQESFHEAVDDYLALCQDQKRSPSANL